MSSAKLLAVKAVCEDVEHYFYVRRQGDNVLFVANVYAGVSSRWVSTEVIEKCLTETWSSCGEIAGIELLQAKKGQVHGLRTVAARLRFESADTVSKIMTKPPSLVMPREIVDAMFLKDTTKNAFQDVRLHETRANEVLALFEADKAAEIERRARARQDGPDDDGFITVTYKRKAINETARESEAVKKRTRKSDPQPTGADSHDNFYRFQKAQAKRQRLDALRSAVQADKDRTAKIAAHRRSKFKPN